MLDAAAQESPQFAYREGPLRVELEQGDILRKTPALDAIIADIHPYYSKKSDNRFFIVVTQSCDLALRDGKCSSRYISIAPIRPIEAAIARALEEYKRTALNSIPNVATEFARERAEQFLQRLLNNNEPGYFF